MKTILQINSVANYGSTGRITEELGIVAINNDWKSYIAYGRISGHSNSDLIKIGTELDIKMHGLKTRIFDMHGLGSRTATEELIKKINIIKPDIIHLHNLHGYYINIEVLFIYLAKINTPIVWTFHDCWPMTGHCAHFDFIKCERWKTECYSCPQKKYYPASFGLDRSRENYHLKKNLFTSVKNLTIVTVSVWLGNLVRESFLSNYPIQVICNGIDTEIFKPLPVSLIRDNFKLKDKFILLGVASIWSQRKGLEDFVELSRRIDSDYQIILVGLTKIQIKTLPANIIAVRRTESVKELASLYSRADILLNLSYEETFGLTTVEGFACGTPGIVYNCTASPELITHDTGIVVEPGDLNGVLKAVSAIKGKGKSYYSEACRNRAKLHYSKAERYSDYIELYKELLKNRYATDVENSS